MCTTATQIVKDWLIPTTGLKILSVKVTIHSLSLKARSILLAALLAIAPTAILGGTAFLYPAALADTTDEHNDRAMLYVKEGNYKSAIVEFRNMRNEAATPDLKKQITKHIINCLKKIAEFDQAEAEYEELLAMEGNSLESKMEFADFLLKIGNFKRAQTLYSEVLASDPRNATALYGKAMCLEGNSQPEQAIECWEALRQDSLRLSQSSNRADQIVGQANLAIANQRLALLTKASDQRAPANSNNGLVIRDHDFSASRGETWALDKMPIHVYIDDGEGVPGYRPEFRDQVPKALDLWSKSSKGKLTFVIDPPNKRNEAAWKALEYADDKALLREALTGESGLPKDPISSEIHIHWTPYTGGFLGVTFPVCYKGTKQRAKVHIWMVTNVLRDGILPEKISQTMADEQTRELGYVLTHELGHALGLPHAANSACVMADGNYILSHKDRTKTCELHADDILALQKLYNNFSLEANKSINIGANTEISAIATVTGKRISKGTNQPQTQPQQSNYDQLQDVIFDIKAKQYTEAINKLETFLKEKPQHAKAHYLKAVALVNLRQTEQAALEYKQAIKYSTNEDLTKLATDGLNKLGSH